MVSDVRFPNGGCWPVLMPADMAAACAGERTVSTFKNKVKQGIYPQPIQLPRTGSRWRYSDFQKMADTGHATDNLDGDI